VSFLDDIAKAPASPQLETLEEARAKVDPGLTLDEYTLARMVYSEGASGTPVELCCLADAAYNQARAAGRTIHAYATNGNGFGQQDRTRPVSTARAPGPRHVHAALAVLRRRPWFGIPMLAPPPARGIARGARRFLSPRAQLALSKQDRSRWCPPLAVLERWSFNAPWSDRSTCSVGKPGPRSGWEEWVGPIPGVDPWRQMFMRPATSLHAQLYREARQVIESGGTYKGRDPGASAELGELALVVVGLGIAAAAAGGVT
jgi:hypothetical protein